ncbi:MAG: ATP-binding protein [Rhodospirillaceae bacterium]|nr:ATP-binding protein [Rhodospirillaceae bacterium]
MTKIRPRDRDAIVNALRTGVVPRVGQHLVQVGRAKEIESLVRDIDRIIDSGSCFRLVIGEYGSGKTFFLNLVRSIALEKKMVAANADLTPDRRFQATGGQARSLYAELMKNIATRTRPDGGALPVIVERFVSETAKEAESAGISADAAIRQKLQKLSEMVGGYDFANVIAAYWKGHEEGNDELKANAIRWLRAEFTTKTDARAALGVRTIIEDANTFDFLKLMALFVKLSGFSGFLVCYDELVNLFKMSNTQARNANYEQVLRILNDSLQGTATGLGILLGGTPEFLMDTRRGLYSYPALQSRLAENTFAKAGLVDFSGPVLRLANLSPEDFYVLLGKLRNVFAHGDEAKYLIPDDGITAYMNHCATKIGDAYFRTPRTTITAFLNLLAILEQNPGSDWRKLLGDVQVTADTGASGDNLVDDDTPTNGDELASFKL